MEKTGNLKGSIISKHVLLVIWKKRYLNLNLGARLFYPYFEIHILNFFARCSLAGIQKQHAQFGVNLRNICLFNPHVPLGSLNLLFTILNAAQYLWSCSICIFIASRNFKHNSKGQLNSEWIYEVIVSPKIPTQKLKDFCPTL